MSDAFVTVRKVCPNCYSESITAFDRRRSPGLHLLSRFYCGKCHKGFWAPKQVEVATSVSRSASSYQNLNKSKGFRLTRARLVILGGVVAAIVIVVAVRANPLGALLVLAAVLGLAYLFRRVPSRRRRRW